MTTLSPHAADLHQLQGSTTIMPVHEPPHSSAKAYAADPNHENERSEEVELAADSKSVKTFSEKIEHIAPIKVKVTIKTWLVVCGLALSSGSAYWTVPTLSTIQAQLAVKLGGPGQGTWVSGVYNTGSVLAFLICGANSDLFGRRYFILFGNVLLIVGCIVAGSASSMTGVIAGMALVGFGGGNCQLAVFAIPELLPNKWRHIGVVIAEALAYVSAIIGPVCARYALNNGDGWRWLFYGNCFANALAAVILVFLYFPPKHPRGIPVKEALRNLDYMGMFIFTAALTLFIVGVIYASYIPTNDVKVVAPLATGCVLIVAFVIWESGCIASIKIPVTPPHLFRHNHGRSFTAPFIVGAIVSMYYLGPGIVWAMMVNSFFTAPTDPESKALKLSVIQGLGILVGAICLTVLGGRIKRWKWQMLATTTFMTLFGSLLGLGRPGTETMSIVFLALSAVFYAWAQYLATAYAQLGAEQVELGVAGGLAGVSRYTGSLIASTVYVTIFSKTVESEVVKQVIPAVEAAGASASLTQSILSLLPQGVDALLSVTNNTSIVEAAVHAYTESIVVGTRTVALASLAFGGVGIIACLFLEDIDHKMNENIEVYLENDTQADKNQYH